MKIIQWRNEGPAFLVNAYNRMGMIHRSFKGRPSPLLTDWNRDVKASLGQDLKSTLEFGLFMI